MIDVAAIGGCSARQGRVLQARSAGSVLTYMTGGASAARREIVRNAPPSVVFMKLQIDARDSMNC